MGCGRETFTTGRGRETFTLGCGRETFTTDRGREALTTGGLDDNVSVGRLREVFTAGRLGETFDRLRPGANVAIGLVSDVLPAAGAFSVADVFVTTPTGGSLTTLADDGCFAPGVDLGSTLAISVSSLASRIFAFSEDGSAFSARR